MQASPCFRQPSLGRLQQWGPAVGAGGREGFVERGRKWVAENHNLLAQMILQDHTDSSDFFLNKPFKKRTRSSQVKGVLVKSYPWLATSIPRENIGPIRQPTSGPRMLKRGWERSLCYFLLCFHHVLCPGIASCQF